MRRLVTYIYTRHKKRDKRGTKDTREWHPLGVVCGECSFKALHIIGEEKNYISLKALPFPEWYETVNRSECHRRLEQRPFCSSRGGMNHAESKGEGRADKKECDLLA